MGVMNVTEFRKQAADAIARAESGEVIEITRNNRTVAELRPRRGAHDVEWNEAGKDFVRLLRDGISLGGTGFSKEDKYGDVA